MGSCSSIAGEKEIDYQKRAKGKVTVATTWERKQGKTHNTEIFENTLV